MSEDNKLERINASAVDFPSTMPTAAYPTQISEEEMGQSVREY